MTDPRALSRPTPTDPSAKLAASTERTSGDGLFRLVTMVFLAIALPTLIILSNTNANRNDTWIPCIGVAVWSGIRLATLASRGEPRLYEFMFWVFCLIFVGLAPAAQIYTNFMPTTTPRIDPRGDLAAALVIVLGVVAFEIGMLSRRKRSAVPVEPVLEPAEASAAPGYTSIRVMAILGLSVLISLYIVSKIGVAPFFSSRDFRGQQMGRLASDPAVIVVLSALSWVPAMVAIHRIAARRRSGADANKLRPSETVALVIAVLLLLIMNNPLSQPRYVFGSMVLSFVVLLGGCRSRRTTRLTLIGLLAGLLLVFPVADAFRRIGDPNFKFSLVSEYPGNGDYDSFAQIHNSITVAREKGLSLFTQPLGVALFWVPRSMWQNKPKDTAIYLAEQRGYSFTNLSAPLWAEFYTAGGALVVGLGFVALGRVLRKADDQLVRAMEGRDAYSVVNAFMPFYMIILLRGSLLQAMGMVVTFIGTVVFTRVRATTTDVGVAAEPVALLADITPTKQTESPRASMRRRPRQPFAD